MRAAAEETGLHIEVPLQSPISDDAAFALMETYQQESKKMKHGSAMAWLAHLDLLQHVIHENYSTALIVEDDVDWAVEIKDQLWTLSEKVREFTEVDSTNADPYGNAWDVLWLGHCGEIWKQEAHPHTLSWPDATAGRREDWRGVFDPGWLIDLPEGHRSIYWSDQPMCTFAFAVSRAGALRILDLAGQGGAEAYDIELQGLCRSKKLKCISVVDQLFHHYRPAPEFGQGSDIGNLEKGLPPPPSAEEMEKAMGSTAVILHSARCKALFNSTCLHT